MNSKPKIYFLGSGNIAVAPLAKLYASDKIELVGIGTQQDRPAGRKKQLTPTPVGAWAADNNIEIDKPSSVNTDEFLSKLRALEPDIVFVASFGQLLKPEILELPTVACVNLHASLLPLYRGASPIAACLLNGDEVTGVTFMKMDEGLDTGPEYCRLELETGKMKADELEIALGEMSSFHIECLILKIASGELCEVWQDDSKATYAGKIKKSDGVIDWSESAEKIICKIRAYHPWPGASFTYQTPKRPMKITVTDAEIADLQFDLPPGETITADKTGWIIATGDKALSIKTLKPEGKGDMTAAEFVRGRPELLEQKNVES